MAIKKSELYSSLWQSCDELRGGMDASQYKDYVLVLLFLKYISDKYAGKKFAPITIPAGSSFTDMVALKGKPTIGDDINKKILGPLAKANPQLSQADFADFNDPNKLGSGKEMVDRLTNLISIFENPALDFSKNRADGDDLLGDAYEYLMRHFATESGKSKGQFLTPAEVSLVLALILGIDKADVKASTTAYDPKGELEHIHYFCGNVEIPEELKARETQRVALYKSAAALVRAYANIADDMPQAGYTEADITRIKLEIDRTLKLREIIRMASGETIDLKAYEADMRYLINSYIEAKEPKKISAFDDVGLLEVIVQSGMADAIVRMPNGIKGNKNAVAETIANNVRKKIIKEHLNDPAFYDKMSSLLKEILDDLKAKRISYEEFLKKVAEQIIKPVQRGAANDTPKQLDTPGKRALYNNLTLPTESGAATMNDGNPNPRLDRVMTIDWTVKNSRQDNWRGNSAKENLIKEALYRVLDYDETELDRIYPIIVAQTEY